jgi:hypothetical protein
MTFGKKPTEATERRKREISKYGKPLSLETCRKYKRENVETVRENWRSWASDETNKKYRKKYHQVRAIGKKNGYGAYFPKFVWVEWVKQGEDPDSPLLFLDSKDYPPLRKNYD